MNLPQENLDRSVIHAESTLKKLPTLNLRNTTTRELKIMAFELDAINQALRHEILNRSEPGMMDLG